MIDIAGLSRRYAVRRLGDSDADAMLAFCRQNAQYYRYCGSQPSRALMLNDLHMTPPGKDESSKFYVGFYDGGTLVAIMDLIEGYPDDEGCYIGFFMMNIDRQGRGTGSAIVGEVCEYLRGAGFGTVRLAIDRDNPQSNHFWKKNGFRVVREVERDGATVLVAEKRL